MKLSRPSRAAVSPGHLLPFQAQFAPQIVGWVADAQELHWLAPSTVPPLTASKVIRWRKPGGRAYAYLADSSIGGGVPELLGYVELNRMQSQPGAWWIGHLVVRPDCRGRGVGRSMLDATLEVAFLGLHAGCVCLVVFPENRAAIRCYEGAGFSFVGEEFHHFGHRPGKHRLVRYELEAARWLAGRPASP